MMGSSNTVFPNLQPRNVDVTLLVLWSIYIAVARGSCWSYSGVNSSKSRRRSTKIAAIACRMWTSSSWCSWWFVLRQCIFHWPCIGWSKGSSNSWHIITPMCIVTTRSLWIACIPSIVVLIWRVHISIVWWHIMPKTLAPNGVIGTPACCAGYAWIGPMCCWGIVDGGAVGAAMGSAIELPLFLKQQVHKHLETPNSDF